MDLAKVYILYMLYCYYNNSKLIYFDIIIPRMIIIMTYTNLYMLIEITYLDIGTMRCSNDIFLHCNTMSK